ncbi:MAG TPA: fused MFS/spermidine synthase [Pirellulales bacterium]|nr:fused MFS/spermidine synthase [Pirellulales bacterium]
MSLATVAALLFVSGMCGLVFQVVWLREFRLVFGASTAASSAVLAVFMGGLGLGNVLLGKLADRSRNPLATYAHFELIIAVAAAVSPLVIDTLHKLYVALGGQATLGLPLATALRLAISVLVMGAAAFFMGGTLPAAVRAVTAGDDLKRRAAATLYGINTLGAVVGALASTFFALEFLGTRETLWLASLTNLVIGLAASALARRPRRALEQTQQRTRLGANRSGPHRQHRRGRMTRAALRSSQPAPGHQEGKLIAFDSLPRSIIYFVAAVSGFSFLLMELVWYRMLGPILGGTTYTFGLILAVALAGIGLGGITYGFVSRRVSASPVVLALSLAASACGVAMPFAFGDRLAIMAARLHSAGMSSFFAEAAGWGLIAAIVILPAAFVSGFQFPLLIAMLGEGEKDVGKDVGLTFGWNTLGAICGALVGGFGLLPLLTAPGVWRLVAALLAAVAAALAVRTWRLKDRRAWSISTAGAAIVAGCLTTFEGPTAVWRHGAIGAARGEWGKVLAEPSLLHDWENSVRRAVCWEAEGIESSIAIVGADGLAFYVNGMCDGNAIGDAGTQIMLGLIGAALHPHPRAAFVVGLGTGETAGWLAQVSSIDRVDVVELEPAVREMARRCSAVNHNALANPKVHLIVNDAREALLTTGGRYDLIACEPSNPYRNGIANLFTRQFYLVGRDRLNDGGLFAQWVQAYEIDERTMRCLFATFKSVFPHVEVWQTKGGDFVLLGSSRRPDYSVTRLRATLAAEPFAAALGDAWHTTGLEGFCSHYVGGPALVEQFVAAEPTAINTDNHNAIEYACARKLGSTPWDAARSLYRQSVKLGDQRPSMSSGAVNWRLVLANRQWEAAVRDDAKPSGEDLALEEAPGDKVLDRYIARDAQGILSEWDKNSSHGQVCLTELAVIAHLSAEAGSYRADSLIEELGKEKPTEAEALRGILALRQGRVGEAGERLQSTFERLHADPWVLDHILTKTYAAAIRCAKADPRLAPQLLRAVKEPFPVALSDEERRGAACVIAEQVSPAAVANVVESFEPHVPWSKRFLDYRLKAYRDSGHRLTDQARRDVREF